MLLDVSNDVCNGPHAFGGCVINTDAELLLQSHNNLDRIKRICAQIREEILFQGDLRNWLLKDV